MGNADRQICESVVRYGRKRGTEIVDLIRCGGSGKKNTQINERSTETHAEELHRGNDFASER
jgi:hypothetical protein